MFLYKKYNIIKNDFFNIQKMNDNLSNLSKRLSFRMIVTNSCTSNIVYRTYMIERIQSIWYQYQALV